MNNLKRSLIRFGLVFFAIGFGVLVMVVAQDVQRLQRQHAQLSARIATNAERIHVLEAEWAYRTRPDILIESLRKADPSVEWVPMRGEDMISFNDFLKTPPTQVADAHDVTKP